MTDAVKEALIDLVEEILNKTHDRELRGRAALIVAMVTEAQARYATAIAAPAEVEQG